MLAARPWVARACSVCAGELPQRSVGVRSPAIHTEGSAQAPTKTRASTPPCFPAIAKRELESASQSIPVSGDLATTANFAEVVRAVPTRGEKQKISGASGASGSPPTGASRWSSHEPRPTPPRYRRRTDSGMEICFDLPVVRSMRR
jgi:hypothetical protein